MTVPLSALTATWNNGATVFNAIMMDVTNTASAVGSALMSLRVGGVPKFNVDRAGNTSVEAGAGYNISGDTIFYRDAAGIFAQRNGTNANSLRVYSTYTDASNYERGVFDWTTTANTLTIGTQAAGTGTLRGVAAISQWNFGSLVQINTGTGVAIEFGTIGSTVTRILGGGFPALYTQDNVGNVGPCLMTQAINGGFNGIRFGAEGGVSWASGASNPTGAPDINMVRDAAGSLAQRNGTNAQSLRVYRTHTDASNYARLGINDNQIKSEFLGTGTLTETTSRPVLDLAQTWNGSAVAFTGLKLNVTNTASLASSMLVDLQVGGTSAFAVTRGGAVCVPLSFSGLSGYWFSTPVQFPGLGIQALSSTIVGFVANTNIIGSFEGTSGPAATGGISVRSASFLGFSTLNAGDPVDTIFYRDAAGIIAQRNGTNANSLRVYNTFTDSSNYERAVFDWTTTANTLTIGAEKAGTGAARNLQFQSGTGTPILGVSASQVSIHAAAAVSWGAGGVNASPDVGLTRIAAKVLAFGDSNIGAFNGWMQWGGQARVAADVNSNNTTTLALATGLSVALQAGRTYSFEAFLSFTCTAAQGIRVAMVAANSLTATNIIYDGWITDSGSNGIKGNAQATALGTVVANAPTIGTAGHVIVRGTITVNAAGNLQLHFAQSVAAANNTTIKRGSYMIVHDVA